MKEEKNSMHKLYKDREGISFTGEELSGAALSAVDLQVALATGRDLDGIDIPGDTPEERRQIIKGSLSPNSKKKKKEIER